MTVFLFLKFSYILYILLLALQALRVSIEGQINVVRIGIHSLLFIFVVVVVLRQHLAMRHYLASNSEILSYRMLELQNLATMLGLCCQLIVFTVVL